MNISDLFTKKTTKQTFQDYPKTDTACENTRTDTFPLQTPKNAKEL
jgi:hypothetical protein